MIWGHEKVALELSGGKDSVACLFFLKDYLDQMTVYWLNTRDPYPETVAVIERCKQMCPNFVEVKSDVKSWKKTYGMPVDAVPRTGEHVHLPPQPREVRCVDSYTCCLENIMLPLHERVIADGNTLIIRGQRMEDDHKGPLKSGDWVDGIQVLYPLENWSNADVMHYLQSQNAPIHPIYTVTPHGVDCLHCTGWWNKASTEFLKRHPDAYAHVMIARSIAKRMITDRMRAC